MNSINLGDAKAHLSKLVERAERGEPTQIVRRGKPVAQIIGLAGTRKPIDAGALAAVTDRMTLQTEDAGSFIRAMRDGDRY